MKEDPKEIVKALRNLKRIEVHYVDGYFSSGCSGRCAFYIECDGPGGYTEDPDFEGVEFDVIGTKKEKDSVILKIRAKIPKRESKD